MGRPLNKKYFGPLAGTSDVLACTAWVPGDSAARTGAIVKQKNTNGYIVDTTSAGGAIGHCFLVTGTPTAAGQMSIAVTPYTGPTEYANKVEANLVETFQDNVYKWFLHPHALAAGQATLQSNM